VLQHVTVQSFVLILNMHAQFDFSPKIVSRYRLSLRALFKVIVSIAVIQWDILA